MSAAKKGGATGTFKHVILSVTLWNRTEATLVLLPPPETRTAAQKPEDEALIEFLNSFFLEKSPILGTWIETTPDKSDHLRPSKPITHLSYFITPPQLLGQYVITSTKNHIEDEDIYAAVGIIPPEDPTKGPTPPMILRATKNRPIKLDQNQDEHHEESSR